LGGAEQGTMASAINPSGSVNAVVKVINVVKTLVMASSSPAARYWIVKAAMPTVTGLPARPSG